MNAVPSAGLAGEPTVAAGEELCLDYANTRFWRGSAAPTETLREFADLLDWLIGHAGLPPRTVDAMRRWASEDADRARMVFAEAVALREAIYRIFAAVATDGAAPDDDLAVLNGALAGAPLRERLVRWNRGYAWSAEPGAVSTSALLAPVLWSTADLLTRIEHRRVRRCANDQCLWLFLDHSKGGTRRWCDMSACGNRAKSRRHYLRSKPAR